MPAKQAINDKLQGSVATYLRCGGVVNYQIKKGLLLRLWVNKFVRLSNILLKDGAPLKLRPYGAKSVYYYYESVRNNHILACNYAKYSPI